MLAKIDSYSKDSSQFCNVTFLLNLLSILTLPPLFASQYLFLDNFRHRYVTIC